MPRKAGGHCLDKGGEAKLHVWAPDGDVVSSESPAPERRLGQIEFILADDVEEPIERREPCTQIVIGKPDPVVARDSFAKLVQTSYETERFCSLLKRQGYIRRTIGKWSAVVSVIAEMQIPVAALGRCASQPGGMQ